MTTVFPIYPPFFYCYHLDVEIIKRFIKNEPFFYIGRLKGNDSNDYHEDTTMKNLIILTLTILLSTSLYANGRGHLAKLNLTTEQKEQIMALRRQNPHPMRADMQKLMTLKKELTTLLAGTNSNLDELKKKYLIIKQLELIIAEKKFYRMMNIRNILTPAQRKKAAELFLSPRHNGGGRGRGDGPSRKGQGQGQGFNSFKGNCNN